MSNQLAISQPHELTLTAGSLDAYINAAHQLPILSADQEYDLATRLRDHQDLEAARQLITHHLRFVIRIARGYNGYGSGFSRFNPGREYWSDESGKTL